MSAAITILIVVAVMLLVEREYNAKHYERIYFVHDVDTVYVRRSVVQYITDRDPKKSFFESLRLKDVWGPELDDPRTKEMPSGKSCRRWLWLRCIYRNVSITRHGKEKYGRTLATIKFKDGTSLNEKIVTRRKAFKTYQEFRTWRNKNNLK